MVAATADHALLDACGNDAQVLANPRHWFGAWDVQHFLAEYGDPGLDEPTKKIREWWLGREQPSRRIDLRFAVEGTLEVPGATIHHIMKLARQDAGATDQAGSKENEEEMKR
jgi:hypothetical protein